VKGAFFIWGCLFGVCFHRVCEVTMQALNVVRNEKYKVDYNIHWREHMYITYIFFMYILQWMWIQWYIDKDECRPMCMNVIEWNSSMIVKHNCEWEIKKWKRTFARILHSSHKIIHWMITF
jgi:hypothetical protein